MDDDDKTTAALGQKLNADQRHNIIVPQLLRVTSEAVDGDMAEMLVIAASFVSGCLINACENRENALLVFESIIEDIKKDLQPEVFEKVRQIRKERNN